MGEIEGQRTRIAGDPPARLSRHDWAARRADYLSRVESLVRDYLGRMTRREKHPVYDFLFVYYSFRSAHLLRWTPGADVVVEGAVAGDLEWGEFVAVAGGYLLPAAAFPTHRLPYARWALEHLGATSAREPSFACFGLHEWAMVYRDADVRHPAVPFRLSRAATDAVVESQTLRCSHYDAFRFFTPAAGPRNRVPLTRATMTDHDQPGCVHANMDLYRFAYKVAPFCPSDVVADALGLAVAAREVDMRASPYDLAEYGFPAVRIETREGREEYVELQRELYLRGVPVRERLRDVYAKILSAAP